MAAESNTIRDEREAKNLTLDEVAAKAGISWSTMCRIERNSAKTTQEEVDHVLGAISSLPASDRKRPSGRPFGDKEKQAAVERARLAGTSVAKVIADAKKAATEEAPAKKTAAKKPAAKKVTAPAKKTAAKKTAAKKPAASRSRSGSRSRARR